uniref:Orexigenic neuropeptide QRFP n=1 Tax=Nothoprocta perdicaria TaxID=30464 RepID=A0A8C7E8E1_NOTPE
RAPAVLFGLDGLVPLASCPAEAPARGRGQPGPAPGALRPSTQLAHRGAPRPVPQLQRGRSRCRQTHGPAAPLSLLPGAQTARRSGTRAGTRGRIQRSAQSAQHSPPAWGAGDDKRGGALGLLAEELSGLHRSKGGFTFRFGR